MRTGFLYKSLPKNISTAILAVVALCLFAFTQSHIAGAAENDQTAKGIFISPVTNQIDLKNGQVYAGKMNVENRTDSDMDVEMSVAGYAVENNYKDGPKYETDSKYSTMQKWIKVAPGQEKFTLKPGENRDVDYTITAPANSPGGTQYATLMATHIPRKSEGSGITALARIGMVIMARMVDGNTVEKAEVVKSDIPFYQPTVPMKADFTVENEGNVSASVQYKMNVYNAITGAKMGKDDSATVASGAESVFPEASRDFEARWDQMPMGFYNVELVVDVNGKPVSIKKFVCAVPIWVIILIIVAIMSLVGYFIVNRKMVKEAKAANKNSGKSKSSTSRRSSK